MVEQLSPLEPVWKPGAYGKVLGGAGVALEETRPGSIVQAAAFPGEERTLIAAISDVTGLSLPDGAGGGIIADGKSAFGIAPGRFLVVDQQGLGIMLKAAVLAATGTITDLSHGRTAIRISGRAGPGAGQISAIDFALAAFPEGVGRSTAHRDIFAQISARDPQQFYLFVFYCSFLLSPWTSHGAMPERDRLVR